MKLDNERSFRRAEKNSERLVHAQRMLQMMKTNASMAEIARRYESGESAVEIGASLGTSSNAIYRRLRKLGVKIRKSSERTRKHCDQCSRPTKGYSKLCPFHWKIRMAAHQLRWYYNNK